MALQRIETDAIEDDAITTAKIAANAVAAADIAANAITNAKVASNAAIAVSKVSGLGTAASLNVGTSANNIVQLDGSAKLPAVDGSNLTGVATDTSAMENNIAILAFKTQAANNLAKFNLIDQVVDEYKDDTGLQTQTNMDRAGVNSATEGYLHTTTISGDVNSKLLMNWEVDATTLAAGTAGVDYNIVIVGSASRSTADKKNGTASLLVPDNTSAVQIEPLANSLFDDNTSGDWTIEFWHKETVGAGFYCHIMNKGSHGANDNDIRLYYLGSNNTLYFDTVLTGGTTNIQGGTSWASGKGSWMHYAMVRNGNTLRLYLNGTQAGSAACSGTMNNVYDTFRFGSSNTGGNQGSSQGYYDELRFSDTCRYPDGTSFTPHTSAHPGSTLVTNATGSLVSTSATALSAPTTGDICMLIEDAEGTATLNTDLKAYVSRNAGTGWDQATLVDKGSWGTNKKILVANNVAFSNSASGTAMRYKLEWANQASGSKETRVHATSLAWA